MSVPDLSELNLSTVIDWFAQHQHLLGLMGLLSIVMFIGSILMLPWLVSLIPADYFDHESREPPRWKQAHPIIRIGILLLKNLLGWVMLIAGLVMLVLPGQGLLSLLIALILMDYPGKYRFERWIITRPALLHLINRLRIKLGKPALIVHEIH